MGHPLFPKNLRKILAILIIKEGSVCLVFDETEILLKLILGLNKVGDPFYPR